MLIISKNLQRLVSASPKRSQQGAALRQCDWVFVLVVVPRRRTSRCDWLAAALAAFTPAFEAERSLRDEKLEGSRIINPSTTTTILVHAHDNLNFNHCPCPRLLAIVQLSLNPLGHFSFTGASLPLHQTALARSSRSISTGALTSQQTETSASITMMSLANKIC